MSELTDKINGYDKLTPEQKSVIEMVTSNLSEGTGLWKPGWRMAGAPESIRGTKYRGMNNFCLTLIAMARGYRDNRWVTYHQMEERDWGFKTDEEGKSLGKGAGVTVEYFELRDRQTKKPFDKMSLLGIDADEKEEYMRENVYPLRKYYRVFNGDVIDGIPEKERVVLDETAKSDRAESILKVWDESECKIHYGGSQAYYSPTKDEIQLPERSDFYSLHEFYGTALHEIGHSTGHEKRLNRDLSGKFGSPEYAEEELRAEIASMFIAQQVGVELVESHVQNNSAYIKSWLDKIQENPNALFTAIADADKISRFVIAKENQKQTEPYAIVTDVNEYGETTYSVHMTAPHGQTTKAINYAFTSREALMSEFDKMQSLPFWSGKELKEVIFDELQAKSKERAEATEATEEKSEEYMPPSEVAARATPERKRVDMTGRGVESLTRMSDREIVDRASKTKSGDKFTALYNGGSVLENEEKDERSLMSRIAMYCNGDKEQLMRIFRSSGQYREGKKEGFYEKMAKQSMDFVNRIQNEHTPKPATSERGRGGLNAKS